MDRADFSDAALILFGHGTTLNSESGAAVCEHASELRRREIFGEVREAFWKQEPWLLEVVREVQLPRVFLLPFFISEGYFSEQVIPEALGFGVREGRVTTRTLKRDAQTWYYCQPVGTHARLTEVLLDRARAVVREFPSSQTPGPAETTLFVAGHGTGQSSSSRQAVEDQVEVIRQLELYAAVHAVYMEEEPRIGACYDLARTRHMVVVPFFISDGLHVREDIPVLLGEQAAAVQERLRAGLTGWRNPTEKHGKWVWYAPGVGSDPRMIEVILARIRETAAPGLGSA